MGGPFTSGGAGVATGIGGTYPHVDSQPQAGAQQRRQWQHRWQKQPDEERSEARATRLQMRRNTMDIIPPFQVGHGGRSRAREEHSSAGFLRLFGLRGEGRLRQPADPGRGSPFPFHWLQPRG